jgi:Circadian oscillating protein COP23
MKNHWLFASILLSTVITSSILTSFSQTVSANTNKVTTFTCVNIKDIPTTLATTSRGNVSVIRWVSGYFNNSGWSQERRCQEVSNRFQKAYVNGTLKYLTTGTINGEPVVCTTNKQAGRCSEMLFTLKRDTAITPAQTLRKLMDVRVRASGPLNESDNTSEMSYINMDEYMATAPIEPQEILTQPSKAVESSTVNESSRTGEVW